MKQALLAEALGSCLLTAAVVGSGIMGARLADGNVAVALLANTAATVLVLAALIASLGPLSGAHFNPIISLVACCLRKMSWARALAYSLVQLGGCCAGAILANAMFELPPVHASVTARTGTGMWLSEIVATAGLIFIAFRSPTFDAAAWRVAAWIGAAYWFTASTSFANPAITVARSLSDTFAGIRPSDVSGFVIAQFCAVLVGWALLKVFATEKAIK